MSKRGIWGVSVELNERGLSKVGSDRDLIDRLMQAMKEDDDDAARQAKEVAEARMNQVCRQHMLDLFVK